MPVWSCSTTGGERNVTTNHIAAHLAISPGNLYYHFRNKADIIYELFQAYEKLVDSCLDIPEHRPLTLDDLVCYLESVFDGLWAYRFFTGIWHTFWTRIPGCGGITGVLPVAA